jgi:UDP-N-acetylglucosamine--N-acetylmuramyl-(pentapeptide) pyrophosphoryl-undecaprenol N-acetylglucosamine transferase
VEEPTTRIVFSGGGTGGHLYPALAVAEELRRRHPHASIAFVGARRGLEQRLVPAAGYELLSLRLGGLKGASGAGRLAGVVGAAWAVARCLAWMLRRPPSLVVGVGGYASGPGVLAASLLRRRTMLLEQNHHPGATNRWLASRVDAVCLPSETARGRIGGRTFVTGNPVRREFFEIGEPAGGTALGLLVFGGSRGARSINRCVAGALGELGRVEPPLRIVHQTGQEDFAEVSRAYGAFPAGRSEVAPFLDDMPARLAAADLVVCRAGASTIGELCASGRPAIVVPYPHAADDHQRHNAEELLRAGAAELLEDRDLQPQALARLVARLAGDAGRRRAMGRAARALARPDATRRIADVAGRLLLGPPDGGDDVP